MRTRLTIALATALTALAALGATGASAATEIGNDCDANNAAPLTALQVANGSTGLLPTAPSDGVITKWRVRIIAAAVTISERMRVFRPTGGANEFTAVSESDIEAITGSPAGATEHEFDTRLSVKAGDHIGAFGAGGTLICATKNAGDVAGFFEGDAGVSQTQTFTQAPGQAVALTALIEPDTDGDGFGDETQDKCPQSAAVQDECPPITLGSYGLALRNAALILATSSESTSVAVSGVVNVPRRLLVNQRGKRKGKGARSSALVSLNGGSKDVFPGQFGIYRLKFNRPIGKALRKLPRKRALTLRVTTSATDVAGRPSTSTTTVKLRGQKPNKPKRAKGKRKAKGKR